MSYGTCQEAFLAPTTGKGTNIRVTYIGPSGCTIFGYPLRLLTFSCAKEIHKLTPPPHSLQYQDVRWCGTCTGQLVVIRKWMHSLLYTIQRCPIFKELIFYWHTCVQIILYSLMFFRVCDQPILSCFPLGYGSPPSQTRMFFWELGVTTAGWTALTQCIWPDLVSWHIMRKVYINNWYLFHFHRPFIVIVTRLPWHRVQCIMAFC